jgi:hypothetical protein
LGQQLLLFSVCPSCHKLHDINDVKNYNIQQQTVIKKCDHIQFPNHRSLRKCNTPLSEQNELGDGRIVNIPSLVYPMVSIKGQILNMYQRSGFEKNLRLWINRNIEEDVLCDIYDGEIWKNFLNSGIVYEGEGEIAENQRFFNKEHADDHLGIMINVDWFQPFERTVYSCGAIYGVICNLPRELRFKPENMIILGILPGPTEPSLHQLNHYLAPIVDQLKSFWEGETLDRTFEHSSGRLIKCAVIACCCDIPAARKLCGHASANICCHRCLKVARNRNFGGLDDIEEWFVAKDADDHRAAALEWRKCKSNETRKRHVKNSHVRWTEMLRLPYFDPIRFLPVDPMHNLFIGIASWIVRRLWLGHGKLTLQDLTKIQKRMDNIHPPSEIGRIPRKINVGEGFSNLTANEWKNFFLIYARIVLWDFLDKEDRKILTSFSQACSILVRRIVTLDDLNIAHDRLFELLNLIEINYGDSFITPNLHLSLHLNECCRDYGPLYSFWCFSFERMNGILGNFIFIFDYFKIVTYNFEIILGSLPNSRRKIEPEIMRFMVQSSQIERNIQTLPEDHQSIFQILENDKTDENEAFESEELQTFLNISKELTFGGVTGAEMFPGEFLPPTKSNALLSDGLLDLLIGYYNRAYEHNFSRPRLDTSQLVDYIAVTGQTTQYGRVRIGAELFGSTLSKRHIRSSYILARFINNDNDIDTYPGQVQFYFEHTIYLSDGPVKHCLAFVNWYKPVTTANTRFLVSDKNSDDFTNDPELWKKEFYNSSVDSIIPVHHILGRFVPANFRYKRTEYLAVLPLNRRFHL